jgi:ABC-type lipoprotein release transport system permease subunit
MIGYASYTVHYDEIELEEAGVYRRNLKEIMNNGIQDVTTTSNTYFVYGDWPVIEENLAGKTDYGVGAPSSHLSVYTQALLAGIDPEQEAKLVGLDEAVITSGGSRYFDEEDSSHEGSYSSDMSYIGFPVIVSNHAFDDKQVEFTIERLDIPFERSTANDVLESIKENGGSEYLETMEGHDATHYSYTSEEAFSLLVSSITGIDPETEEPLETHEEDEVETGEVHDEAGWMNFRASPLEYRPVTSPFENQWPYAYQVQPIQNDVDSTPAFVETESFREPKVFGEDSSDWPRIRPEWIGFYDPSELSISMDPLNELPMETYRPATAELVIDANNEPVNPSQTLKPTDNPYDFLTNPPNMLTTIDAAEEILGEEPIAAIRVKVAGVADMSENAQGILERVAQEIESETGLMTDITLGSSPQPTLTHVPAINDEEEIGWLQQPWVNIGSSISIFRESTIGYFGIILSVIAVAVIYVWASALVSLLARRKEFATLLSIGWRPGQLSRLLFTESFLLGSFVAMISWMMLGYIYLSTDAVISPVRFLLTGFIGFAIYLLGAVLPMIATRNISPYEAMRTGEISKAGKRIFRTRGLFSMGFNHFIGKWKRSLLSIIAIALPTGLLALFLHITFRLQGVMYTTWLGQYTALEVGAVHYAAIIVALIMAVLTTAEIMWQNIAERQKEIALLKAVGWKNGSIRMLIWSEGLLSGIAASVIGLAFAFSMMWGLFGEFPTAEITFILSTGFIPVIIGIIGTIIPAERAVSIHPTQGIGGRYSNTKSSEKVLKGVVASAGIALFSGFVYMMIQVVPEMTEQAQSSDMDIHVTPTAGDVGEVSRDREDAVSDVKEVEAGSEEIDIEEEYPNRGITEDRYLDILEPGENYSGFFADFYANEVKSSLKEPEEGFVTVAVEFTFKNLEVRPQEMNAEENFTLRSSGDPFADIYEPEEITVIESEGWDEEEGWLDPEGEITAVMEFEAAEQEEGFLFHFIASGYGRGILIVLSQEEAESDTEWNSGAGSNGDYFEVLKEGEDIQEHYNVLSYIATEVESEAPSAEEGMKNIAIEFTFDILDNMSYDVRPDRSFSLLTDEEEFQPTDVIMLEAKEWEDAQWLRGHRGGYMRAVLEFVVPDTVENYGLRLRTSGFGTNGVLVKFE